MPASSESLSKTDFSVTPTPNLSDSFEQSEWRTADKKYLVFYLNDEIFAVLARQVSEVVQLPFITALPRVPEWLMGIANLRGEIVSVVDLEKLRKKENSPLSAKTKLVCLRGEDSNFSVAFAADKLGEVISLPDNEIKSNEEELEQEIFGQAVYKGKALNLLDAEMLIDSLKPL
jgi:purine-binding chemotaxis protein CheW